MPGQNTTRQVFCVTYRQGGASGETGASTLISQPFHVTPPRPISTEISTRLPVVIDCRERQRDDPNWHYVGMSYMGSSSKTRSPIANQQVEAFTISNFFATNPSMWGQLHTKTCSVNLRNVGQWSAAHGSTRHTSQRDVMGAGAHAVITDEVSAFGDTVAQQLPARQGKTPVQMSHWLHLIAYSLSDVDPQRPENLVAGSAGSNYDHIIFENLVAKIADEEAVKSGEVKGTYTVSAQCTPNGAAVAIRCELLLELQNGNIKKITYTFDPTKPKLTDKAAAARDEETIHQHILNFIRAPLGPAAQSFSTQPAIHSTQISANMPAQLGSAHPVSHADLAIADQAALPVSSSIPADVTRRGQVLGIPAASSNPLFVNNQQDSVARSLSMDMDGDDMDTDTDAGMKP